jgi:hypothetical protein
MTEEQKFLFDLKGWILLPSVLSGAEVAACKAHLRAIGDDPPTLPEHERNSYSGPCQELLDHPAILPVLREIISPDLSAEWTEPTYDKRPEVSAAYGFRCDNSFYMIRPAGEDTPFRPHNGGPNMGPSHQYQFIHGKIFSPAVRIVWELTPVKMGGGGTLFLSGSHKSNYDVPNSLLKPDEPQWESYECPAGSVVIFSENLCHGSAPWTDRSEPRMAVFNHYMHYCMRFHRSVPPQEAIEEMPPIRQTLFRDVWMFDHQRDKVYPNTNYGPDNRAHDREI